MESNQEQDFGALLNNFSDSTPAGQSNTGNDFGSLLNQPSLPKPKQAATTAPIDSSKIDAIAQQESLTPTQKTVMAALLGQESGNGTNTVTSTDGARGAGQIMPATFTRYAKQGESIDNQDHNLAVMARIVKDLGNKFGDSPEKIATGYFSGEGNVNKGQGSAWKNDAADGNGKRVSSYVSDVLNRVGAIKPAQAQAPKEPPKWAEIEAKPEYAKLSDAEKIEAKNAYFDYYVAPHVGKDAEGLRKQFLEKDQESDGVLGTLRNLSAGVLKIGPTAVKSGADLVRLATGDK
jgi:hypothetical protein